MGQKYNLSFFTGRIKEIGSALMHDLGNYDEKISADIINVIKTDEDGRIWFYIKRPIYAAGTPISFPVSLQFLRKGKNFYLKITGVAKTTNNYNTVNNSTDYTVNYSTSLNLTLVEMKINSIEYAEYDSTKKESNLKSWIRVLVSQFLPLSDYSNGHTAKIILN
jgi:hypothetical protein